MPQHLPQSRFRTAVGLFPRELCSITLCHVVIEARQGPGPQPRVGDYRLSNPSDTLLGNWGQFLKLKITVLNPNLS